MNEILGSKKNQTIFVDFFDTLIHRTVHPSQVIRLWSKLVIRELGLDMQIDELYFIRKDASNHLAKRNRTLYFEVDYDELIAEVYNRLSVADKLTNVSIEKFTTYFELAEYRAEVNVQYLNREMIRALKKFKSEELRIYCVSDFYTSAKILKKLLRHHGIIDLFDGVFVSADYSKSKRTGNLYSFLLEKLKLSPSGVTMIGDSLKSDVENAKAHGINAIHIPNQKDSKTKKRYLIGSDRRDYRRIVRKLRKSCNSAKVPPNSDYVFFYLVYIERLYQHLKIKGIKDILFLAREGLFLKKMFEHYQQHFSLDKTDHIKAHYFKTSRQASMLVSLKPIMKEKFIFLKRKYPHLSIRGFLRNFTFSEDVISLIIKELDFHDTQDEVVHDFLESKVFEKLKTNETFLVAYDKNRCGQARAFKTYLDSFGIDFKTDGMHLADIGWGGSMQECLFDYFDGEVSVQGYYLGLNEIYNVLIDSPRWGLNFSIHPYSTYSDNILRGNTELNEQLLSAPHGSTLSYNHLDTFTNEYHNKLEKQVYDKYIAETQDFMFEIFKRTLKNLDAVCYDNGLVQKVMTDYALKIGLFASKRKVANATKISEGLYANVGDFSNGLTLSPRKYIKNPVKLIMTFLLAPDKLFPFLLRIKPYLYTRKKYFMAYLIPMWLIYAYIRLNRRFKKSVVSKFGRFKYDYLR